jgi:transketolase C-terminal domain/subunit
VSRSLAPPATTSAGATTGRCDRRVGAGSLVDVRTTRADTPVIHPADDIFAIGGSTVVRESDDDQVTIVAAGITVHEALRAADALAFEDGIAVRQLVA